MTDPVEIGTELEIATRLRLRAAPWLVEQLGARFDWGFRAKPPLPALVLETISDPRPHHFKGPQGLRETRVQGDAWAASRTEAKRIAMAVINAMQGRAEIVIREEPGWEREMADAVRFEGAFADGPELSTETQTEGVVHRARFDLNIWWALSEGDAQ